MAAMTRGRNTSDEDRERRLAEALRANLRRRKEQARAVQESEQRDDKSRE